MNTDINYLVFLGIIILVVGFALKLNSIACILVSMITTVLIAKIDFMRFIEIVGNSFVSYRTMLIFVIIMLVTGTLERNGLREVAGNLISSMKNANSPIIIALYGVMRVIFAAFNVSFGGVAGFVKPVIMPMIEASLEKEQGEINENYLDELKGMASGMENIAWFFGQVLFTAGAGNLLVYSTLENLGYEGDLNKFVLYEIPVAIFAIIVTSIYYFIEYNRLNKKYGKKGK